MKSKRDTDLALWAKLKNGNVVALGDLYDLYIDDLFSYGLQYSSDKAKVMDSIHDVFLNLYKYRKNLAETNHVKYYLLRSLKNQILKQPKSKSISQTIALHENLKLVDYSSSIEDQIIAEELNNDRVYQLTKAMRLLSKKQRQGLLLRFTEERDYEDISRIMNVSVQTSRTLIYRAIKALRKNMLMVFLFLLNVLF